MKILEIHIYINMYNIVYLLKSALKIGLNQLLNTFSVSNNIYIKIDATYLK